MDEMTLCFEEGYRAYVKTIGKAKNPYAKGTVQHRGFAKGWAAALLQCGPVRMQQLSPKESSSTR